MVPWLAAHRGVAKREAAARFGIGVDQLDHDLDLVMMVGVPPYSPGDYITVDHEGDTVDLWLAPYFTRPLRLSPSEGLALLAAGRALLAVPGSDPEGPLATALDKLERALGDIDVDVHLRSPDQLEAVRDAAEEGRTIEIDYWSAGRDELTSRRIDPGPPFFALGEWYTDAYCHLRDGARMFRVDRIRAVRPTDERFEPADGVRRDAVYHPRPEDPRVVLDVPPESAWVADSYPVESVEDAPGGRLRITLVVSERVWLERLLLRLGPDARVVAPAELTGVGASAARRVLTRYDAASGS
jgi:proteasome accessory factor C